MQCGRGHCRDLAGKCKWVSRCEGPAHGRASGPGCCAVFMTVSDPSAALVPHPSAHERLSGILHMTAVLAFSGIHSRREPACICPSCKHGVEPGASGRRAWSSEAPKQGLPGLLRAVCFCSFLWHRHFINIHGQICLSLRMVKRVVLKLNLPKESPEKIVKNLQAHPFFPSGSGSYQQGSQEI